MVYEVIILRLFSTPNAAAPLREQARRAANGIEEDLVCMGVRVADWQARERRNEG